MKSVQQRLSALREAMKKHGVDAFVIPSADPHLSEYLPEHWQARRDFSGFTGSAGTLVVTADKAGVWTDSLFPIAAVRPHACFIGSHHQSAGRTGKAGKIAARLPMLGQVFGKVRIGGRDDKRVHAMFFMASRKADKRCCTDFMCYAPVFQTASVIKAV